MVGNYKRPLVPNLYKAPDRRRTNDLIIEHDETSSNGSNDNDPDTVGRRSFDYDGVHIWGKADTG